MAQKQPQKPKQAPITPQAAPQQQPKTAKPQPPKEGMKFSLNLKLSLLLALVTFLVYANTLHNGFVLDDSMVYSKNTIVTQGFHGIPELMKTPRLKGFAYLKNENYRPLSLSMFAVEVGLFGVNATAAHFFNILFFIGCVVLLFLFLDKLFERKKTVVSFIAALLFAVHPIHTEVVANIKSLDEIFCFFFAFLTLNLFALYMERGKIWQLALGLVALFCSFLSKETVITFLGIIPIVFFLYLNKDKKRAIFMTAGAVVVAGIYLSIRTVILNDYGASTSAVEFIDNALVGAPDIASRIATALLTLGMYIKLLFIPYPLSSDYGFHTIPYVGFGNIWVLLTLAIYLGLGVLGLYRMIKFRKDPWAFGIMFFLATIALFTNIFFLMGSAMGERFLFFASVGFCLLIALCIEKWVIKREMSFPEFVNNKVVLGLVVVLCLAFAGLTYARNADWKDNYTLFKTDLSRMPENTRLNYYYGNELAENTFHEEKDTVKQKEILHESIACLNKSLAIYPKYTDAYTELGTAYLNLRQYDSAAMNFKIAISQSPYQSIAANNLGTVYLRTNQIPEAIEAYKLAIKIKADFVQAYCNLGSCYMRVKKFDSAIFSLNQCLAIDPGYTEAYMQLGLAYYFDNKFEQSEPFFKKVLEMTPTDVNAANNLGAAYLGQKKYQQALDIFKQLVAGNPNYVNGYSNMGHCYFQLKQYENCIQAISKALQLDPNDVNDIPYLALSYQGLGNMAEARKYEAIAQKYFAAFKL
jgi:tetratricopeptide (TPR) repeat protein